MKSRIAVNVKEVRSLLGFHYNGIYTGRKGHGGS